MATSAFSLVVTPKRFVSTQRVKNGEKVIIRGPKIEKNQELAIFTVVYLASLCLSVAFVAENVLAWYLASLLLFLLTALIYTPDMIRLELIAWSALAVHLIFQIIHAASYGDNPYLTAIVAFTNAFGVLLGNLLLVTIGLIITIVQSSIQGASTYHHISLAFSIIPIIHVIISKIMAAFK